VSGTHAPNCLFLGARLFFRPKGESYRSEGPRSATSDPDLAILSSLRPGRSPLLTSGRRRWLVPASVVGPLGVSARLVPDRQRYLDA